MRKYHKAPLPFLGQKRNWLKTIYELNFDNKIVIDLFGGSGILSHEIKRNHPTAKVVWNDFDNYIVRLNQIESTEALRAELCIFYNSLDKNERIKESLKKEMLAIIEKSACNDFVTISSWILFSGNYEHSLKNLVSKTWYFNVPKNPLSCEGYLKNVECASMDFRKLIDYYKDHNNVIFIADPPYIMTNQQGYIPDKNGDIFKLRDAIDLIKALKEHQSILFSSTKSETDDLLQVFNVNVGQRLTYKANAGGTIAQRYTELMYLINWS